MQHVLRRELLEPEQEHQHRHLDQAAADAEQPGKEAGGGTEQQVT